MSCELLDHNRHKTNSCWLRNRKRLPAGFTLLEVLLALGVFIIAATMLSRLVFLGIENARAAQEMSLALNIAQSRFADLDVGAITINDVGSFYANEDQTFQWTMTVTSTNLEYLYNVSIEVKRAPGVRSWSDGVKLQRLYFDEVTISNEASSASGGSGTAGAGAAGGAGS